jgi:3'-5' exoribonuclease
VMVHAGAARSEPGLDAPCVERLTHAILAHHGRKEWGAPVEPQTVEAWLVHLADLAESRLWDWSNEEEE